MAHVGRQRRIRLRSLARWATPLLFAAAVLGAGLALWSSGEPATDRSPPVGVAREEVTRWHDAVVAERAAIRAIRRGGPSSGASTAGALGQARRKLRSDRAELRAARRALRWSDSG